MTAANVWRHAGGRAGLLLLGALILLVLLAPPFLPAPYIQPDPEHGRLLPPGAGHLLGTDDLSRDVLARVVAGGRVSLGVAAGAVLLSVTLGTLVGLTAGYLGGWVDQALMRLVDAALAVPRLFLLLIIVGVMQRIPLGVLILAIGATGWFGTSRLVRAEVLRLRTLDFVLGARALGAGPRRVVFRHLLPNVLGPLTAATTLAVGDVILLEAGLSFLGLGVQPPTPSWGGMILAARSDLVNAPWVSLAPGLAIVLTVLAVNLVGEALQEPAGEAST
ncbi:MAG TPA: ABC transporter permease [Gemmatimonadales bacterium]|nr:ABC transporter permease [Gemmatimonadales bacterium]